MRSAQFFYELICKMSRNRFSWSSQTTDTETVNCPNCTVVAEISCGYRTELSAMGIPYFYINMDGCLNVIDLVPTF